MSTITVTLAHARAGLIETARVPIAIIGTIVFPALSLLFFVVPNRAVADNPEFATQAVVSLSVFAIMVGSLFGFALAVAESREKPWDPYLRTLPVPGIARVAAHLLSTGLLGLVSIIPVIVIGALATAASAPLGSVLLGIGSLALVSLPFTFGGMAIGFALSSRAAIAIVQITMFSLAFGGGLFLPPQIFAEWLEIASRFLPSRHAREIVIGVVAGAEVPWWALVGSAVWTIVALIGCLVLYRRDEGRRFR